MKRTALTIDRPIEGKKNQYDFTTEELNVILLNLDNEIKKELKKNQIHEINSIELSKLPILGI